MTKPRTKRLAKLKFIDKGQWETRELQRLAFLLNMREGDFPDVPWRSFEYGSMRGQFRHVDSAIELLAIANLSPGNGHFKRMICSLENQCRQSHKSLRIRQFNNTDLKAWFIRRGYSEFESVSDGTDYVERQF